MPGVNSEAQLTLPSICNSLVVNEPSLSPSPHRRVGPKEGQPSLY